MAIVSVRFAALKGGVTLAIVSALFVKRAATVIEAIADALFVTQRGMLDENRGCPYRLIEA